MLRRIISLLLEMDEEKLGLVYHFLRGMQRGAPAREDPPSDQG